MLQTIIHEIRKLHVSAHLPLLLLAYSVLNLVTFSFAMRTESAQMTMLILLNINLVLFSMIQSFHIARTEIQQGKLEYSLICDTTHHIFFSKLIALIICTIPTLLLQDLMIYFTTNDISAIYSYIPIQLCLVLQCSALGVLSLSIQAFFRNAFMTINIMITCFTIPCIILLTLITAENYISLGIISMGITLITIPICYLSSCYLLSNIYSLK